jgi:hypothetical protein
LNLLVSFLLDQLDSVFEIMDLIVSLIKLVFPIICCFLDFLAAFDHDLTPQMFSLEIFIECMNLFLERGLSFSMLIETDSQLVVDVKNLLILLF